MTSEVEGQMILFRDRGGGPNILAVRHIVAVGPVDRIKQRDGQVVRAIGEKPIVVNTVETAGGTTISRFVSQDDAVRVWEWFKRHAVDLTRDAPVNNLSIAAQANDDVRPLRRYERPLKCQDGTMQTARILACCCGEDARGPRGGVCGSCGDAILTEQEVNDPSGV